MIDALTCSDVERFASSFVDREVTDDLRISIGQHLSRCIRCREEVRAYRRLSSAVKTLSQLEPDAGLADRVRGSVGRRSLTEARALRGRSRTALVAVGVIAVLAVACAYGLGRRHGSRVSSPLVPSPQASAPRSPRGADEGLRPLTAIDVQRNRVTVAPGAIPVDAQFRAGRALLGDVAHLEGIPKDLRRPLFLAQLQLFDLLDIPGTVEQDPTSAQLFALIAAIAEHRDAAGWPSPTDSLRRSARAWLASENGPKHRLARWPTDPRRLDLIHPVIQTVSTDLAPDRSASLERLLRQRSAMAYGDTAPALTALSELFSGHPNATAFDPLEHPLERTLAVALAEAGFLDRLVELPLFSPLSFHRSNEFPFDLARWLRPNQAGAFSFELSGSSSGGMSFIIESESSATGTSLRVHRSESR